MVLKTLRELNQDFISENLTRTRPPEKQKTAGPDKGRREMRREMRRDKQREMRRDLRPDKGRREMRRKPAAQQQTQQSPVLKDLLFLLVKVASITLTIILLFTFLFGIERYQEPSMDPAITDGDLVLFYRCNKNGFLPQDVIVLEYDGQRQARRVVATAGDTVDIGEDSLVINGAPQQEPEIYQKTQQYQDGVSFPLTVPEGQVFVLGDSRIGATDSRIYGCVKREDILGKVMTVVRRRGI